MSAPDAVPLPRAGEVFFDVRGNSRTMRLSWYADTGVAVLSIWQGGMCTGTFRLAMADLPRLVDTLKRGPVQPAPVQEPGAAQPPADGLTEVAPPAHPARTAPAHYPGQPGVYRTGQVHPPAAPSPYAAGAPAYPREPADYRSGPAPHRPEPAGYPAAQPAAYATQAADYPGQPAGYPGEQPPDRTRPARYPREQAPDRTRPAHYPREQARSPGYPGEPAGYPGEPAGYPGEPAGYPREPAPGMAEPVGSMAQPASRHSGSGYLAQQSGYEPEPTRQWAGYRSEPSGYRAGAGEYPEAADAVDYTAHYPPAVGDRSPGPWGGEDGGPQESLPYGSPEANRAAAHRHARHGAPFD